MSYARLTFCLLGLVALPVLAKIEVEACEELLAGLSPEAKVIHYQNSASNGQTVSRGLNQYVMNFSNFYRSLALGRHRPDFHWIDVGAGTGTAALESFFSSDGVSAEQFYSDYASSPPAPKVNSHHRVSIISKEDLFGEMIEQGTMLYSRSSKTLGPQFDLFVRETLKSVAQRQREQEKFRSFAGRYFEDIPDSELGQADLITDYFGAFSYSANKIEILLKFAKLLKPGGGASIRTKLPMIEIMNPQGKVEIMSFDKFLSLHPIAGIQLGEFKDEISLHPTPETITALEKLRHRLTLVDVEDKHLPPVFYYRFNSIQ